MTDIIAPQPTDDALREHTMTDVELGHAEFTYAGYIRLLASGRYHARISVIGKVWDFSISETLGGERELTANYPEHTPPLLLDLAWHRAAEAMLAHRRGHKEAQERKELRKPRQD